MSLCHFAVNIHGGFVWLQRENHLRTKFIGQIEVTSFSVINRLPTWLPHFFPDKKSSFFSYLLFPAFCPIISLMSQLSTYSITLHQRHCTVTWNFAKGSKKLLHSPVHHDINIFKQSWYINELWPFFLTLQSLPHLLSLPLGCFSITCLFLSLVKNTLKEFLNHSKYQVISLFPWMFLFSNLWGFSLNISWKVVSIIHAVEVTAEIYII